MKSGDTFVLDMAKETLTVGGKRYKLVPDESEKPKPYEMTAVDWQRVIDEGFPCEFTYGASRAIDYLAERLPVPGVILPYRSRSSGAFDHCQPMRVPGIRQPHFGGGYVGKADDLVWVKTQGGVCSTGVAAEYLWPYQDWAGDIVEYIVLERLDG
jgi:hypothetical protein